MKFLKLVIVAVLLLSELNGLADAKKKKKSKKSKKDKKKQVEAEFDTFDPYEEYGDEFGSSIDDPLWYTKPNTKHMKAWKLHDEGMELAKKKQFKEALPRFRAAVRIHPNSPQLWNDLGVTELRAGELQKAKSRFLKALELVPDYESAIANDKDLREQLGEEEYSRNIGEFPQKHKLSEVPEMDPDDLMDITVAQDFENSRLLGDAPFVVRGAAEAWGWNISTVDFAYLKKIHGHKNADYYPHNMQQENVKPLFSTLEVAIEELTNSLPPQHANYPEEWDFSLPGTYVQWNVDENSWRDIMIKMNATLPTVYEDSHWTTRCFDATGVTRFNQNLHWKMMLIGEKGAGMFVHTDVMRMASWQVQLKGRKLWHVCGPSQDSKMYHAGDVNWFKPDYEKYPKALKAKCYQTITEEGDSMYYPRDWWHQTINLDDTNIAFSGSMINNHCVREFAEQMNMQCGPPDQKPHNVFNGEPAFCKQVEKCNEVWTDMYGERDPVADKLKEELAEKKRITKEKKKAKKALKKAERDLKKAQAAAAEAEEDAEDEL
jgi:tetratricopeptide (TPR) repeat protein